MIDYVNWKVLKSVINYTGNDEEKIAAAQAAQEEYTEVANWCNENNHTIKEYETYYGVIECSNAAQNNVDNILE